MSATQQQMKKTVEKEKKPRKVLTDVEARKDFSKKTNSILKSLGRVASRTERIMRKNHATETQIKAFRDGFATLIARGVQAASGEASGNANLVPDE